MDRFGVGDGDFVDGEYWTLGAGLSLWRLFAGSGEEYEERQKVA